MARPRIQRVGTHFAKWRALTLVLVYVLMIVHVVHWRLAGRTLAPLELNEVMYTAELGIVTAGFLFMALTVITTAVFGRFFCGWGCHILALEDACAWLLAKARIRPKPVRSHVIAWVPLGAALYMFVWPQVARFLEGRPVASLRIAGDAEGWASFVTEDYWRNLPGPAIAILTFIICGFLIVYVLGSRSFCKYVCPYGALFSIADRVAPGRIRLKPGIDRNACLSCGKCTGVCQSHIRVHEELAMHGAVVSADCLKDLDCVAVCPKGAIRVSAGVPPPFRTAARAADRRAFDFTFVEELTALGAFLLVFLSFRGLYGEVPLLMALAMGVSAAYLTVKTIHMFTKTDVRFNRSTLKSSGKWTGAGRAFASAALLFALFTAHSSFVRAHEALGDRSYRAIETSLASGVPKPGLVQDALGHYEAASAFGLMQPTYISRRLASLYALAGEAKPQEHALRRVLADDEGDAEARIRLASLLIQSDRLEEAIEHLRRVEATRPRFSREREPLRLLQAEAARMIGAVWLLRGAPAAAVEPLLRSLTLHESATAHAALARAHAELQRWDAATESAMRAVEMEPSVLDWRLLHAQALAGGGRREEAATTLKAAADRFPCDPRPHYLLGRVAELRSDRRQAAQHYQDSLKRDRSFLDARRALSELLSRQPTQ